VVGLVDNELERTWKEMALT